MPLNESSRFDTSQVDDRRPQQVQRTGARVSLWPHHSLCYFCVGIVGALLAGFLLGKTLFTAGNLIIESLLWSLLGAVILPATCPSWAQSEQ